MVAEFRPDLAESRSIVLIDSDSIERSVSTGVVNRIIDFFLFFFTIIDSHRYQTATILTRFSSGMSGRKPVSRTVQT
ncbi:MAG: hypothetical protein JWM76_3313 [Pseudonocardiales bacterium]|nr:hypothetical protein [Pseudonocardiales bacterium]